MEELLLFPSVEQVLRQYAEFFHNDYEQRLIAHDRYASGALIESIRTRVVVGSESVDVVCNLRDYWKYVENDTRPHWPPPDVLRRWVEIKPTIPKPLTLNGREISSNSLAYLIGRRIAGLAPDGNGGYKPGGTKGTHDMEEAKKLSLDTFRAEISRALGRDVINYIRKLTPGAAG